MTTKNKKQRNKSRPSFVEKFDRRLFVSERRRILELLLPLMDGDHEAANLWLSTPTSLLFGSSPEQAIATGEGQMVAEWLKARSGLLPS
jgi:hypothetical protein